MQIHIYTPVVTDWDWLTIEGAVGEIPVKIQPDRSAEFVVDAQYDISIESFIVLINDRVVPDDVCIFTAEIVRTESTPSSISVEIAVRDIEYVRKIDTDEKRVNKMVENIEQAEPIEDSDEDSDMCTSCGEIDQSTRVTVKDKGGRDLHYCSKCERLLSTDEYERWLAIR